MTPEEQDRQVKSSVAEQVRYINEALKRAEAGSEEWQRWLLKHGDIAVSVKMAAGLNCQLQQLMPISQIVVTMVALSMLISEILPHNPDEQFNAIRTATKRMCDWLNSYHDAQAASEDAAAKADAAATAPGSATKH